MKRIKFRSLHLLYNATQDGFSSRHFHALSDGSGAALVLVRSVDVCVFGGYTPSVSFFM
jgi:hypothetical protein